MSQRPYIVFISTTQRDTDLAHDLSERIKQVGDVRVLLAEESLTQGESWANATKRNLKKSDEVIMLVTENMLNNPNVAYEVGISEGLGKLITPIVVNVEDKRIPVVLADFPSVRWSSIPSYIQKLGQRVQNGLSVKAESKSAAKAERKPTKKGAA